MKTTTARSTTTTTTIGATIDAIQQQTADLRHLGSLLELFEDAHDAGIETDHAVAGLAALGRIMRDKAEAIQELAGTLAAAGKATA